jgi:hypothetical protein
VRREEPRAPNHAGARCGARAAAPAPASLRARPGRRERTEPGAGEGGGARRGRPARPLRPRGARAARAVPHAAPGLRPHTAHPPSRAPRPAPAAALAHQEQQQPHQPQQPAPPPSVPPPPPPPAGGASASAAAPAPPDRVRFSANVAGALAGDVLVLSAGSLSFNGSHPGNASIAAPEACRAACAALPGCSGWTFCGNGAAGCGSGCKAYTQEHPKSERGTAEAGPGG